MATRVELALARIAPRLTGKVLAHRLRRIERDRGRPTFASPADANTETVVLPDEAPTRP